MSKGWDLTSLHSLDSAVEWVRKGSGALLVLVVRAEDVAFAVDPAIAAKDAAALVEAAMPEVGARLKELRERAQEDARLKAIRDKQRAAADALKETR